MSVHPAGVVLLACLCACGVAEDRPPHLPRFESPKADLAPGQRSVGASLFGTDVIGLPTGTVMTPDAAPGSRVLELNPHITSLPDFRAGSAVATVLSPDKKELLVLTSGYNRTFDSAGKRRTAGSSEYVFVYDVSRGEPHERGVVVVPNAFGGIAYAPRGDRFYVGGGSDDAVYEFSSDASGRYTEVTPAMPLGHLDAKELGGLGINESPYAAGIAVTPSGDRLAIANYENDSLSIVDLHTRSLRGEVPLGAGGERAGGEFPYGVTLVGDHLAYVTSQRDREVVEVDLDAAKIVRRLPVGGEPTKIIADRAGGRLFVANANSDTVSIIDRATGYTVEVRTVAGEHLASVLTGRRGTLRGSNPNALSLSPDEHTLFVTNGGNNTVAVIALGSEAKDARVVGLIPVAFYPDAVSTSVNGDWLYVAHGKGPGAANPLGPWSAVDRSMKSPYTPGLGNQFSLQLRHATLVALPVPSGEILAKLTTQSILNNRFLANMGREIPAGGAIHHVIYVIGENRSYDQIFGDLKGTDADPSLLHWGQAITPNAHAIARGFVALDRFFDSGGVSGDGWQWTVGGRTTDAAEKGIPVEYANRGHRTYDWEGMNRGINISLSSVQERKGANPAAPDAPDLLPGHADVGAIDGPDEGGRGFLWDIALAAGLSVRNYGCFLDESRYGLPASDPASIPLLEMPMTSGTRVAFPTRRSLWAVSDPYYRGFDMKFPDVWRVREWAREFDTYVSKGALPALELVRLPHDHLGSFATATAGLDTPDTQIADHDYALGLMIERVSRSPFWKDTVIIALEDDAQNGADHVHAQRSFVLFAGAHVKRGAVVSNVYTTTSVLRTIELILGLPALGQEDAVARPIDEVFVRKADARPFVAEVPGVLRSTTLQLPPAPTPLSMGAHAIAPRGDKAFWAHATETLDFTHADQLPTEYFNHVLACGLLKDARACAPLATPPVSAKNATEDRD